MRGQAWKVLELLFARSSSKLSGSVSLSLKKKKTKKKKKKKNEKKKNTKRSPGSATNQ